MSTIICKKCGAKIDASLGECPNCGAVYYILPEDNEKKLEWAMSMDIDSAEPENGEIRDTVQSQDETTIHSPEILKADNDELFNTRVWKVSDNLDDTKTIKTQPMDKIRTPVPPANRPVRRTPTVNNGSSEPNKIKPNLDRNDERKKRLFVSAVALLAVLTLVLTIMGGAFDFNKSESKELMPNVLGFTEDTAKNILGGYGLQVETMEEHNEAVAGTVIRQSIKDGRPIKKGDKVTLIISKGLKQDVVETIEYIEVPSLLGKTYNIAKSELDILGLNITTAEDVYSNESAGKIVSQNPLKGAKLKKGDIVTVTISKGPEPSPSPTVHTITVTAGKGGSISPKGLVTVEDGKDQTFMIVPDSGYEVKEVKVNGTNIGAVTSYTFENVKSDQTLYVVFKREGIIALPSPDPDSSEGTGFD